MRLPSGFGSVYKKKGNRRNPWAVVVTIGMDKYGKQIRKVIGYVKKPELGIKMLSDYHNNPYDLNYKNLTFKEIWQEVNIDLNKLVSSGKMTQNNVVILNSVFKNHCYSLHNEKILELRYKKMQYVIDTATKKNNSGPLGYTAKENIITVCKKIFEKAINDYELPIDNNPALKLKIGEEKNSNKHIPYSSKEESILWGLQHIDLVKIILIMNYTGNRPNELFNADREKMFIDSNYYITGSKTEAGKERPIPIHPKIKHLFLYFYNKGAQYPFKTVFEKFNYGKFSRESTKLFNELGFNHTPYDSRHTFVTKLKSAGVDDNIIKRIVGHRIEDITEKVYTHRSIEELYNAVKKIN